MIMQESRKRSHLKKKRKDKKNYEIRKLKEGKPLKERMSE